MEVLILQFGPTIIEQTGTNMSGITIQTEILPEEKRLASAMSALLEHVPNNELGFPIGYYRCDLLPFHDYEPEESAIQKLFEIPQPAEEGGDPRAQEERQGEDEETSHLPATVVDLTVDVGQEDPDDLDIDDLEMEDSTLEVAAPPTFRSYYPTPVEQAAPVSDRIAGFRRKDLSAAFILLSYDEGFPTQPDGRPFWERLENEPIDAYMCFEAYLQMPNVCDGIRGLSGLPLVMVENKLLHNTPDTNFDAYTAKFRTYHQLYNWSARTKAYDFYKIAAMRKALEHRATTVQDRQFRLASRLRDKLSEYLDSNEEFWDMMTPKVAVDMLKVVSFMERINAGLPGAGPQTEKSSPQGGMSFEMILRQLATAQAPNAPGVQGDSGLIDGRSGLPLASRILADPKLTNLAQELILRMTVNTRSGD